MLSSLSNSTSLSQEASQFATISSHGTTNKRIDEFVNSGLSSTNPLLIVPAKIKKKRNLPGNPDPEAEVIALSPKTLMATNRFICEICKKGFQRDQNLQLHRRGHNLPFKLKQRNGKEMKKRAYVCPEISCVHHNPSRALGDLTGIKKHFCRKHGEKKWKCGKCSKVYAVQSDWKAHSRTCGTREYRCDCGTIFSRKDSFITHRAFCDALAQDALAQESARLSSTSSSLFPYTTSQQQYFQYPQTHISQISSLNPTALNPINDPSKTHLHVKNEAPPFFQVSAGSTAMITSAPHLSATALLQKASTIGATSSTLNHHLNGLAPEYMSGFGSVGTAAWQKNDHSLTRDFLGLNGECNGVRDRMLTYEGGVGFAVCHERDNHSLLKKQTEDGFGFNEPRFTETWGNC